MEQWVFAAQCPYGTEWVAAHEIADIVAGVGCRIAFGPCCEPVEAGATAHPTTFVPQPPGADSWFCERVAPVTMPGLVMGVVEGQVDAGTLQRTVQCLVGLRSVENFIYVVGTATTVVALHDASEWTKSMRSELAAAVDFGRRIGMLAPFRPPFPIRESALTASRPFGGAAARKGEPVLEVCQETDDNETKLALDILKSVVATQVSTTESEERVCFRVSAERISKHADAFNKQELASAVGYELGAMFSDWTVSMRFANIEFMVLSSSPQCLLGLKLHSFNNPKGSGDIHEQFGGEFQRRVIGQAIARGELKLQGVRYAVGSPASFKHDLRDRKGNNSMNPAIAHYLVTMARLLPGEIVLDPLAGTGTIPIEAAVQCRGAVAFGGDLDRSDVSNQSWNFSEGVLPLYLQGYNWCGSGIPFPAHCFLGGRWNAVKIPFRDGTVDAIISDLPFGKRCGNAWTNAKLYPRFFENFGEF